MQCPVCNSPGYLAIRIKLVRETATLPEYKTSGAVGADLRAVEGYRIEPGVTRHVPTGIAIELPAGFEGQVRPRSGMSSKGLIFPNSIGTIDQDYRGEIWVPLYNLGPEYQIVQPGDRIAQLVISPVAQAKFIPSQNLSSTGRGENGFGSTGVR